MGARELMGEAVAAARRVQVLRTQASDMQA
jgi:hypothetical protein